MAKISILIPTCNRASLFKGAIASIYQHTTHKKNLEILILVDDSDLVTQSYVKATMSEYERHLDMRMLLRTRSEMLNEDYYNWAARQSSGDLMWVFADDLTIVAPNWDEVVQMNVDAFTLKHPDRVFCVSIRDNTPSPSHKIPKFPCFPMFTREAMAALGGWILHPKIPTWGADKVSYDIFHPIGRLLEINDRNYINHISWHTKQCEVDATNQRIGDIFNRLKGVPHHSTDRIIAEEVVPIRLELCRMIKEKGFEI